jgi:CRP-like cAMP-binding protein
MADDSKAEGGGGRGRQPSAPGAMATASGERNDRHERLKTMIDTLGGVNIFSGLPAAHLKRIAEIGNEESHAHGATIFAEGEPGTKFYLILEGAVRISRIVPGMGEEALAVLRSGKYFGEMSLIDDSPRSAHALVHEKCKLFVITKRDLEDLLFVDRDLAYELLWNFVRTLTGRLRETNDKMTFLATSNKF